MALLDPESPFRDEMSLELRVEAESAPVESSEDETDLLAPLTAQEMTSEDVRDESEDVQSESPAPQSYAAPDDEAAAIEEPELDLESIEEAPFDLAELEAESPLDQASTADSLSEPDPG